MNVRDFVSLDAIATNSSTGEVGCNFEELATWEKKGGVLVYIAVLGLIFYLMEAICDEYFVPALNILSERLNLSDDVAGATFMAAGASSPELFVSLTGVLSNSPVGTGTVVGSELFNMLCICGGSALVASSTLHLDWRILAREVIFYALSIVLLLVVLQDKKVEFWEALLLVGTYSAYVVVCGTYASVIKCLCPVKVAPDVGIADSHGGKNSINPSEGNLDKPLLTSQEDVGPHERILRASVQQEERIDDLGACGQKDFSVGHSAYEAQLTMWDARQATSLRSGMRSSFLRASMGSELSTSKKSGGRKSQSSARSFKSKKSRFTFKNVGLGFPEEYEESNIRMHGFLFKKSRFYSRASISSKAWQRRWFMLKKNGTQLRYCRNPLFVDQNLRVINLINVEKVQVESNLDILLHSSEQIFHLRARDRSSRNAWRDALTQQIAHIQLDKSRGRIDESDQAEEDESEDHPHILSFPSSGFVRRFVFIVSFPVIFCFHFTIPDPRQPKWTNWYPVTLATVVAWLAAMSFVLVTFSDKTGCILNIPPDVMGLTIGSIGTSLPNLFASMLVAKQGLGNMAISNAFGSNVFNIFIALGVPWTVATLILDPGHPYPVESSSIGATVIMLAAFLIFFVLVMGYFRMKLTKNIGRMFIILYLIFIIYMSLASYGMVPSVTGG